MTSVVLGRWLGPATSTVSDRNGGTVTRASINYVHGSCFDNVLTGSRPAASPLAISFVGVM